MIVERIFIRIIILVYRKLKDIMILNIYKFVEYIYIYKFIRKIEQHFPNYENTIERNNYSTFVNRSKCDGENII